MSDNSDITVMKVDGIGNMVSIDDLKKTVKIVMNKCKETGLVYHTYGAVLEMLISLSNDYDADLN